MALYEVRDTVAVLQQLGVDVPRPVLDGLTTASNLVTLHRQLATRARPIAAAGGPLGEEQALARGVGAVSRAALKGKLDVDTALAAADDLAAAQAETARIVLAMSVLDAASGGAASRPLEPGTSAEAALIDAADDLLAKLHALVMDMCAQVPARLARLGGDLPRSPAFALTASDEAKEAYVSLEADAKRYRLVRVVQRRLYAVALGDGYASLWNRAEISRGLDQREDSELDPLTRFVRHSSRHVWVPTIDQLQQAHLRAVHESNGSFPAGLKLTEQEQAAFKAARAGVLPAPPRSPSLSGDLPVKDAVGS